jgi:hypothetical protein
VEFGFPRAPARAYGTALALLALPALVLSGCGAGSNATVPPTSAVTSAGTAASSDSKAARRRTASLELRVKIPRRGKRAKYISRSTQSIAVTEGTVSLGVFNTATQSQGCSTASGATFCTFRIGLIPGPVETLVFTTYDQPNGQGSLLSTGSVTQQIKKGLNLIAVTLEGVVSKVQLALQSDAPPAGTPATSSLTVMASDADGNIIVGAGNYTQPITLSTSDTTGTVTLSPASVTGPDQPVTVSYDGRSIESVSIGASSSGVPAANVTGASFAPVPTVIQDVEVPTSMARHRRTAHGVKSSEPTAVVAGPDGNIWAAISNSVFGVVSVVPSSGTATLYSAGTAGATNLPAAAITGLASDKAGNVWYVDQTDVGEFSTSAIASGNTSAVTDYSLGSVTPTTGSLCAGNIGERIISDGAGGMWFTIDCATDSQLGHVTAGGAFAFYNLTGFSDPQGLVLASDGNIYIAGESSSSQNGAIVEFNVASSTAGTPIDLGSTVGVGLVGIAQSSDGDLWATTGSCSPSAFVRFHSLTALTPTVFPTLGCSKPFFLTALADGTLWAPDNGYAGATRVTPGVYPAAPAQYSLLLPTPGSVTGAEWDVALGTDGDLYFADNSSTASTAGDIAKVAY